MSVLTTVIFVLATINLFGDMVNSLQGQSDDGTRVYYVVPEKDEETSGKTNKK